MKTALADPLQIVYTSNINGALQNCGCGAEPLGGIGRIKTVVDSLRSSAKNFLLIDGGDFCNSYPYPELNRKMHHAMQIMQYDVMVPGDHEMVEGADFYNQFYGQFKNVLLLTNQPAGGKIKSYQFPGIGVEVAGILSPDAFEFIDRPGNFPLNSGSPVHFSIDKKKFRIVVFHGDMARANELIGQQPDIDLVLIAHDNYRGIRKIGTTTMVGNGRDSEYFSLITVEAGNQKAIKVVQIKVVPGIEEDDEIKEMIDAFLHEKQNTE